MPGNTDTISTSPVQILFRTPDTNDPSYVLMTIYNDLVVWNMCNATQVCTTTSDCTTASGCSAASTLACVHYFTRQTCATGDGTACRCYELQE